MAREPRERPSAMHPDVVLGLTGGEQGNPNAITRKGGSRLNQRPVPRRLVVDVREFMSSLPSVLYQQGLDLVPLTLEVRRLPVTLLLTPCQHRDMAPAALWRSWSSWVACLRERITCVAGSKTHIMRRRG